MPATKPLRSGTCAITLLAMITSAGLPSRDERAGPASTPKNSAQRRDAGRLGGLGLVGRRIDAEHGDAVLDEVRSR